jgi:hypothetical protein
MITIEVCVMTVGKLPDMVLVKVVGLLELVGAMTLGKLVYDEALRIVVEVLVKVVVDQPGIVLASVETTVEMVCELALPLGTGSTLPRVVGVTLVSVVAWPPETILVISIMRVDSPNDDEIGSVLVGNVGKDNVDAEGLDEVDDVGEGEVVYGDVNVGDRLSYDGVMDMEEMAGVISGVLVISVLN